MKDNDDVSILLVDDRAEDLMVLESVLADLGPQLVTARSGKEALRHLLSQDFAVILLDAQMPIMDGYETARLIRERQRSRHTPIIFLTGVRTSDVNVFEGYSVGAVDYLFKPIVPEVLKFKVAVFVDLFKTRKEVEAANAELESFSYSVAHDLRAPLRGINAFAQILQEDCSASLDDNGKRCLERVLTGATRMEELIDDMLAFSRVARDAFVRSTIDMGALVREVVDEIKDRPVSVRVGHLPLSEGDRAMIRQVLSNLVSNAFKFTKKKEQPLVEIGSLSRGDETVYFVRDNGAGFDMTYANQLFSLFRRLHTEDEYEGTGVGLAIVQRIVKRHGGQVWAEAKVGEGATVYFTLSRNGSKSTNRDVLLRTHPDLQPEI
ncbi:MAG: hybrid sensor histidine kinase/response regulator [Blastocatellia bacterium AA13]|nr:MAG: hybrid sensor histidine kinase/response regulator [Blastocatellia bacterium AA13]